MTKALYIGLCNEAFEKECIRTEPLGAGGYSRQPCGTLLEFMTEGIDASIVVPDVPVCTLFVVDGEDNVYYFQDLGIPRPSAGDTVRFQFDGFN